MLGWAAVFFSIAMAAGIFGFGGIAASVTAGIAKALFAVFLVSAGVSLLIGRRHVVDGGPDSA
jgi:uncharacterized membrane protein YtjA (UPF0391 family)